MSNNEANITYLQEALARMENRENSIYFLTYDTKNNARAAVKHIYDMALALHEYGFNSKILVEDKSYSGVKEWLDNSYDVLPIVSIKEDKIEIKIDDVIVVPEYYSNVLPQLSNIKCVKVILVQQKDYIFETLSIGSRWSHFGFDKCITTTDESKKYILDCFPESLVYIIPPAIGDNFVPYDKPNKPFIAINCRDRMVQRRIISEFYLKYPQLRWITFRDMVQMSYHEFSEALKECMVSVWVDDESTFGTFPLESMKCGVPVIGKVPDTTPEWLAENGFWTYDGSKIVELLGTFVLSWIDGSRTSQENMEKMKFSTLPFSKEILSINTLSVFSTLLNQRIDTIKLNIEKFKISQE